MPVKPALTNEQLLAENARLLALVEIKNAKIEVQGNQIESLSNQLYLMRHARFGRKT